MAIDIVEKVCTVCKTLKTLDKFGAQKRKKDGKEAQCLDCVNAYRRGRRKDNPTPGKTRDFHLWVKYKMRPEEYEELFQSQNGVCAICGKERHLRVDHCHATDVIRGLLCAACNIGLGNLGDTIEGVEKALNYLRNAEKTPPKQPSKMRKPHVKGDKHHWYGRTGFVGRGVATRGSKHPNAILTEKKVHKILTDWNTGNVTQGQLSEEHGVSVPTIQSIVQRHSWKHVVI